MSRFYFACRLNGDARCQHCVSVSNSVSYNGGVNVRHILTAVGCFISVNVDFFKRSEICNRNLKFPPTVFPKSDSLILCAYEVINTIFSQHIFGLDWESIIFIDFLALLDVAHTCCYGWVLMEVKSIFIYRERH